MKAGEAIEILEVLASDLDPIEWKGQLTTAHDLARHGSFNPNRNAKEVTLRFFADGGGRARVRWVEGTLAALVLDRMGYLFRVRPTVREVDWPSGLTRTKVSPREVG